MTMVSSGSAGVHNYEFAMNSEHFVDKTLRIEIIAEDASRGSRQHQPLLTADGFARQQKALLTAGESQRQPKRKRENRTSEVDGADIEENCTETGEEVDTNGNGDSPKTNRVKSIKVFSVVLAFKSEFFQKLFTSPTREAAENKYTIRILDREENALDQLLEFIYKDKFTTTDPVLLIETLVAADKYSVLNAVDYCCSILSNLPMSTESAILYLELHSLSTVVENALKSLRASAAQFLVNEFREIKKSEEVLLAMPLSVIKAIFASSEILVPSEDYVFHLLFKWSTKHCVDQKEHPKVFNLYLFPLIRVAHLTASLRKKLLVCKLLDQNRIPMLVDSLLYTSGQRLGTATPPLIEQPFIEQRIYHVKPIRVMEFNKPCNHSVVYVDFSKSDLENLLAREVITEKFLVGAQTFHLVLKMNEEPTGSGIPRFGVFLSAEKVETITVDARFSVRRIDGEFFDLYGFSAPYTGSMSLGVRDLFRVPWAQLITEGRYLIDDFLYLRAEVRQQL